MVMIILKFMREKFNMNKIKFFILMITLIVIDQLTKFAVIANETKLPINVINGFLSFTYCENRGIAFGMASGHVKFFSIFTLIILAIIVAFVFKYFHKVHGIGAVGIAMLIAGGFGNFIDRAFRLYVVDFIDVGQLFSFPIFNFADICVVMGVIILGISILIGNRGESIE